MHEYLLEAEQLDLSVLAVGKYITSAKRIHEFLTTRTVVEHKTDGVKLTVMKVADDGGMGDFIIAYKGNVLYSDEYSYQPDTKVKHESVGASQFKKVFEHVAGLGKTSIPVGTELFIEFLMRKPTLSSTYSKIHKMVLIGHSKSSYTVKYGKLKTKDSGFDTSKRDAYAKAFRIDVPQVLFTGVLGNRTGFAAGIQNKHLDHEFGVRSAAMNWDNEELIMDDLRELFLSVESKYGGAEEGVVVKYAGRLLKWQQSYQLDQNARAAIKARYRDSDPTAETAYWDGVKLSAMKIVNGITVKSRKLPDLMRELAAAVKHASVPVHSKKTPANVRDDVQLTAKTLIIKGMRGNNAALIVGKFRVLTKGGHVKLINQALRLYDDVVVNIVTGKDGKGTKDIRTEMLTRTFPGIHVTHSVNGSLTRIIGKSPVNINVVYAGSDRVTEYSKQLNNSLGVEVKEMPRTDSDISATEVITNITDREFFEKSTPTAIHGMYDKILLAYNISESGAESGAESGSLSESGDSSDTVSTTLLSVRNLLANPDRLNNIIKMITDGVPVHVKLGDKFTTAVIVPDPRILHALKNDIRSFGQIKAQFKLHTVDGEPVDITKLRYDGKLVTSLGMSDVANLIDAGETFSTGTVASPTYVVIDPDASTVKALRTDIGLFKRTPIVNVLTTTRGDTVPVGRLVKTKSLGGGGSALSAADWEKIICVAHNITVYGISVEAAVKKAEISSWKPKHEAMLSNGMKIVKDLPVPLKPMIHWGAGSNDLTKRWNTYFEEMTGKPASGSSKTPKTDMITGKYHISLKKRGGSQLMSGGQAESLATLAFAFDNTPVKDKTEAFTAAYNGLVQDVTKQFNSFKNVNITNIKRDIQAGRKSGLISAIQTQLDNNTDMRAAIRGLTDTPSFKHAIVREAMTGDNKFKTSTPKSNFLMVFSPDGDRDFNRIDDSLINSVARKTKFDISMKSSSGSSWTAMKAITETRSSLTDMYSDTLLESITELESKMTESEMSESVFSKFKNGLSVIVTLITAWLKRVFGKLLKSFSTVLTATGTKISVNSPDVQF